MRHFTTYKEALDFEYYIKGKRRSWKIELIEKENPKWRDLFDDIRHW